MDQPPLMVSVALDAVAVPGPERLRGLLQVASAGLLERGTAVRLAALAALAGEHVLLVGPPGTAKSALARRLHGLFAGARYFERLLTRFSTPEELFGPLSLKALEEDRYERLTDGFLPTAGIAFLDEVFKANSAILNALLTLLNEREFDNGTARLRTPLVAVVAASNEVPADEALHAFYDRFLVRVPVAPVGDAQFQALLALPADGLAAGTDDRLTQAAPVRMAEREALAERAAGVTLGAAFLAACGRLRQWLAEREAPISDRRWRQIVGLVRVAAASEGRAEVDALDLWLAPYVVAHAPQDAPAVQAWFEDQVLALPAPAAPWLQRAVEAFEKQLEVEQSAVPEGSEADDGAGKLALARSIGMNQAEGGAGETAPGMQRLVSERLEAGLRRRWSTLHIQARAAQVDELLQRVHDEHSRLSAQAEELRAAFAPRLWMAEVTAAWLARLDGMTAQLAQWQRRLQDARDGFLALPQRGSAPDDTAPAPIPWTAAAEEAATA